MNNAEDVMKSIGSAIQKDEVFCRAYERARAAGAVAVKLAEMRLPPRQHSACGTKGCPHCER